VSTLPLLVQAEIWAAGVYGSSAVIVDASSWMNEATVSAAPPKRAGRVGRRRRPAASAGNLPRVRVPRVPLMPGYVVGVRCINPG